jgi:hypothetical protein
MNKLSLSIVAILSASATGAAEAGEPESADSPAGASEAVGDVGSAPRTGAPAAGVSRFDAATAQFDPVACGLQLGSCAVSVVTNVKACVAAAESGGLLTLACATLLAKSGTDCYAVTQKCKKSEYTPGRFKTSWIGASPTPTQTYKEVTCNGAGSVTSIQMITDSTRIKGISIYCSGNTSGYNWRTIGATGRSSPSLSATCGSAELPQGLNVRSSTAKINAVQLICDKISDVDDPDNLRGWIGVSGGSASPLKCPERSYLVGLQGRIDSGGSLVSLSAECSGY